MKYLFIILSFLIVTNTYCQPKDSTVIEEDDILKKIELGSPILHREQFYTDTTIFKPSSIKKNSLQFELLGNAGVYSINYERILLNKRRFKTSAQIGFSFYGSSSWKGIMLPIGITEIYLMGNNHLELGFAGCPNYVWRTDNTKEWDYIVFGRFGYRYQKPNKNFIFRAAYMPILYPQLGHWGGIAFGRAF